MDNWDDLRFFLAVVRYGSISMAAEKLHVNHSTVSRRISGFEKKLESRLFDRIHSGYVLTDYGEKLYEMALKIEDSFAFVDRNLANSDTQMTGKLLITSSQLFIDRLLMPVFAKFLRRYPNIEIEVVTSNEDLNLNRREADVAIRSTTTPPENLIGHKICEYASSVYASNKYLSHHGCNASSIIDSSKHSWIGWCNESLSSKTIEDYYSKAKLISRVNSKLSRLEAVKSGIGFAQLPCFLGDDDMDQWRKGYVAQLPEMNIQQQYAIFGYKRNSQKLKEILGHE